MEDAGQKLKRARERLNLRYRDVEEASIQIAQRHHNEEFIIALSRLSDMENKGTVPTLYRLYALCAIYRLDLHEVLEWYGIRLGELPADAACVASERTHLVGFSADGYGDISVPLSLDPGVDLKKTSYLSRLIQRWGKLPLALLDGIDPKNQRYALIGSEDWTMYPIIQPGSLVVIDETRRKIASGGWTTEFERPIYFFEHRNGYAFGWCTLADTRLILQPHPASMYPSEVYTYGEDIDVLGQITGVAMTLDHGKRRRTRT